MQRGDGGDAEPIAVIEVRVTCGDMGEAETIAEALVAGALAACVHLAPVRSVYRWDGAVHRDDEVGVVVTTIASRLDAVLERITELHSYDLPAVWWTPVAGTPDAEAWARQICSK